MKQRTEGSLAYQPGLPGEHRDSDEFALGAAVVDVLVFCARVRLSPPMSSDRVRGTFSGQEGCFEVTTKTRGESRICDL